MEKIPVWLRGTIIAVIIGITAYTVWTFRDYWFLIGGCYLVTGTIFLLRLGYLWLYSFEVKANTELLEPDERGNYKAIADYKDKTITKPDAGNVIQPVSHTVTYAPHNGPGSNIPAINNETPLPAPAPVPSFGELVSRNIIQAGKGILLGFNSITGEQVWGDWKDIYSALIAGTSGSGKTTTVRYLCAQAALNGARFLVADPHLEIADESLAVTLEPLNSHFLLPAASRDEDILRLILAASSELSDRIDGSGESWPLIICIDEFTTLMRGQIRAPLKGLIEDVTQQGRKMMVFVLAMGQIMTVKRTGGSEVRDSFASNWVHRLKVNQARTILPNEEARIAERLNTGQCIFYDTNGRIIPLTIPNTTIQDVSMVKVHLPLLQPVLGKVIKGTSEIIAGPDIFLPTAEKGLIDKFLTGVDIGALIREEFGITNGPQYQAKNRAIQSMLRSALKQATLKEI